MKSLIEQIHEEFESMENLQKQKINFYLDFLKCYELAHFANI